MKEEICKQIGGNHYQGDFQPLDLILKYNLNFIQGSVIKYVTRHRRKNKEEDLLKALSLCETGLNFDKYNFLYYDVNNDVYDYCKKNELNSYLYENVVIYILNKEYKNVIDNIQAIIKTEYGTII
mgnify:CR=1 FL=1